MIGKLWLGLILLPVLTFNKAFAAQGSITWANVSLSTDPNHPTHSPNKTVPVTATGFTVTITTDPTWTNLGLVDVQLSTGGMGRGSVHIETELLLSTGGWYGINGADDLYGGADKSGTPGLFYFINRQDLGGQTLRVVGWGDRDQNGNPVVIQVNAKWNF